MATKSEQLQQLYHQHQQMHGGVPHTAYRIILAGQKAVPGCARVRIVGNPEVVIVSQRRVKP